MRLVGASRPHPPFTVAQGELGDPHLAVQHDDGNPAVRGGGCRVGDQHVAWVDASINEGLAQHPHGISMGTAQIEQRRKVDRTLKSVGRWRDKARRIGPVIAVVAAVVLCCHAARLVSARAQWNITGTNLGRPIQRCRKPGQPHRGVS